MHVSCGDVGIKNLGRQNLHEQCILELSLKCIWPDPSDLKLDLPRSQGQSCYSLMPISMHASIIYLSRSERASYQLRHILGDCEIE